MVYINAFRISISVISFSLITITVVTSDLPVNLLQNPGKGVNFYGKIQSNQASSGQSTETFDDLMRSKCGKASKDSSCLKSSLYHYPGILCQIEDPIPCDYSYPYRTYDGTCNNPHISRLGMVYQCYERFLPAYYEGFDGFRKSVSGGSLPGPRDLSLKIFKDLNRPTVNLSFQFVLFGEYVTLDLVHTVKPLYDCCSEENANNPKCKNILLSSEDPFYSQFNKTCISFSKTDQCDCKTGIAAKKNGVTSALDLSQLYGNSEELAKETRMFDGTGMLKHNDTSVGSLLPSGKSPDDPFCPKGHEPICFKAADPRVNHHSITTSLMTIFMREHNRIATELKQINPHWGEEKLYQEARKILVAEYQCIIYKDFLQLVLSPRIAAEFGLEVQNGTNGIHYNSSVILGIWNEFAISSFRLHSMVAKNIGALNLKFMDIFSNPDLIRQGHLTELMIGSNQVPCEQSNRYMTNDLTNYLYRQHGVPYGKDLASLDVQRGRDHGLAPYVEVVKFCSEGKVLISSFDDLHELGLMPKENAHLLQKIYAAVEDIDMYVGMQLENHLPESVSGPSAACINAKQFYFIQKGDRFYFDLEGPEAPFTADQRSALKKCSFARILCDNTEISEISKNPFLLPNNQNLAVSCQEIPKIDLVFWSDNGSTAGKE